MRVLRLAATFLYACVTVGCGSESGEASGDAGLDAVVDASGDAGTDAVVDASDAGPDTAPDAGPVEVVLSNLNDFCSLWSSAAAWPASASWKTLTRVTAPFDLDVEVVNIRLYHAPADHHPPPFDGACNAATAFQVEVFRGTDTVPPEDPVVVEHIDVEAPAPSNSDPFHQVQLALSSPLTLLTGEHLFVAVEMARPDKDHVICVRTCRKPAQAGFDFWSTAAAPPYGWKPFEEVDIGGPSNLDIEVEGHAL